MIKFRIVILTILFSSTIQSQNLDKKHKLNVLFIVADDLNCDIGAYGNKTIETPNMINWQKKEYYLEMHVQYPWCGPSISFMTGLYPDQTKIKQLRIYLRQAIPKLLQLDKI